MANLLSSFQGICMTTRRHSYSATNSNRQVANSNQRGSGPGGQAQKVFYQPSNVNLKPKSKCNGHFVRCRGNFTRQMHKQVKGAEVT